jgi:glycosyltransferase involved in cell wall biosynthesis
MRDGLFIDLSTVYCIMWLPLVSIILPAYNCEKYIASSVTSIIEQVYDNFELIIINDGSTDKTASILNSLTDQRIRILHNDGNKGLIFSLNRAIDESRGEFIARMDADDIATNDRIEKQVHWLLHHPDTAVAGTFIKIIDENGLEKGDWKLDRATCSAKDIRKAMVRENCLAHPTIMARAGVLRKYKYHHSQRNIEDYDLWLRMLADGLIIEKLPQPLLHYRDHASSITGTYLKTQNPRYKNYLCKKKFLKERIQSKKWTRFESAVAATMINDWFMAVGKSVKQRLK